MPFVKVACTEQFDWMDVRSLQQSMTHLHAHFLKQKVACGYKPLMNLLLLRAGFMATISSFGAVTGVIMQL